MEFPLVLGGDKKLIFDSELKGVMVSGKEFIATKDSPLIYDQLQGKKEESVVRVQMTANTSTLIPALRILGISYPAYFDERPVVESQNDVTFYWNKSKLAAYYNRYSTDHLLYADRKQIIKAAVAFLTSDTFELPEEYLSELSKPCKVLGFFEGFPIFDSSTGLAKLVSRLGIHIDPESIMISTPFDEHSTLVYNLATKIGSDLGIQGVYKKNRVTFSEKELVLTHIMKYALGKPTEEAQVQNGQE